MVKEPSRYSDTPLENSEDATRFLSKEFLVYDGEIVIPREIFKSSILLNATWILLFHNHPSGRLVPSKDDKFLTQRVREAGMILGIELKDHVIIGNREGQYYSFYEAGIFGRDFRSDYVEEMYDLDR